MFAPILVVAGIRSHALVVRSTGAVVVGTGVTTGDTGGDTGVAGDCGGRRRCRLTLRSIGTSCSGAGAASHAWDELSPEAAASSTGESATLFLE